MREMTVFNLLTKCRHELTYRNIQRCFLSAYSAYNNIIYKHNIMFDVMQVLICLKLCRMCCIVPGQGGSPGGLLSRILGSLNVGGPGACGPPGMCYFRVLHRSIRRLRVNITMDIE